MRLVPRWMFLTIFFTFSSLSTPAWAQVTFDVITELRTPENAYLDNYGGFIAGPDGALYGTSAGGGEFFSAPFIE